MQHITTITTTAAEAQLSGEGAPAACPAAGRAVRQVALPAFCRPQRCACVQPGATSKGASRGVCGRAAAAGMLTSDLWWWAPRVYSRLTCTRHAEEMQRDISTVMVRVVFSRAPCLAMHASGRYVGPCPLHLIHHLPRPDLPQQACRVTQGHRWRRPHSSASLSQSSWSAVQC